jgi:hypothetical protein
MSDLGNHTNESLNLEEFARLQLELDRKAGSMTGSQQFALLGTFVLLAFVLGSIGQLFPPFGTIFAAALTTLAIITAHSGMKNSNIRTFLDLEKEAREDQQTNSRLD